MLLTGTLMTNLQVFQVSNEIELQYIKLFGHNIIKHPPRPNICRILAIWNHTSNLQVDNQIVF